MRTYIFIICTFFLLKEGIAQTDPVNWTKNSISTIIDGAKKHTVADLDNDGDLDIALAANPEGSSTIDNGSPSGRNICWFENNGNQVFTLHDIDLLYYGARVVQSGDINGDGYIDLVAGTQKDSSTTWYENDGSPADGGWIKHTIGQQAPYNYSISLIDLDKDGNLDIVDGIGDDLTGEGMIVDSIRWHENDGNDPPTFIRHLIVELTSPVNHHLNDFNNDGYIDIVAGSWTELSDIPAVDEGFTWWSQDQGAWTEEQTVVTSYATSDLSSGDLDGDNDFDIIAAGWKTQTVDWWRNTNGVFGSRITIASNFMHARNTFIFDIDGDADLDIVAAADDDNTISWFENDGNLPNPNFIEHEVDTDFTYAYYASAADLDGDGDADIIGSAQDADELAWWENDLNEDSTIAAGDQVPVSFWNDNLQIDFNSGDAGNVSVFYNAGENVSRSNIDAIQVNHIASHGYYTIVTDKSSYNCDVVFSYAGVAEWSAINDENDLIICYWDDANNEWTSVGNQTVDTDNDEIIISGLTSLFTKFSKFTLGSSTTDNALPVELISFRGSNEKHGIKLFWSTESEINNQGFEIWKKSDRDTSYHLLSTYKTNETLTGLGTSSAGNTYSYLDTDVRQGQAYSYRLFDIDYNGRKYENGTITVDFVPDGVVRVVDGNFPQEIDLRQNYPNPFNSRTIIEFSLLSDTYDGMSQVSISVYNMLGKKVITLIDETLSAGSYQTAWNGNDQNGIPVSSGVYIYRIQTPRRTISRLMNLVK